MMINDTSVWAVYGVVFGFTALIIGIFAYPMAKTTVLAHKEQHDQLDILREKLMRVYESVIQIAETSAPEDAFRTLNFFEKFKFVEERVKAASTTPFSQSVFLKFVSASVLPLIFTILEKGVLKLTSGMFKI